MEKNNEKLTKKKVIVLLVLLVLVIIIGTSYALWQLTLRQTSENTITTGCFKVEFTDDNPITLGDAYPISDTDARNLVPYQFTITNICSNNAKYEVNLEVLNETSLMNHSYIKTMFNENDPKILTEYESVDKTLDNTTDSYNLEVGYLDENQSKTFNLRLWLSDATPLSEDIMNKIFSSKVTVITSYVKKSPGTIRKVTNTESDGMWEYKYNITKLVIQNRLRKINNAVKISDESVEQDKSIMSYVVLNEDGETYTAYLQGQDVIYLNQDSSNLFYGFQKLEAIEGLEYLDSFGTTNMSYMFYNCYKLENLDLSKIDASNVTNMSNMFYGCVKFTSLDFTGFDTSKVTDMSGLFSNCSNLTNLDISGIDTRSVTTMLYMFENCSSLTSLDISSIDTSSVTNISGMFERCSSLSSLNVSGFNTSNVTTMNNMFRECSSLTSLDLGNFDTSKVTDMLNVFERCSGLISINVSSFDTSKVTRMACMFSGCSNLISLNLSNFDTSKVITMTEMFQECSSLTELDLGNFDTSKVKDMGSMFKKCGSLTSLNLSSFDTSQVGNMEHMFNGCRNLTTTLTIGSLFLTSYKYMFNNSATESGAKIVVNYKNSVSSLVDEIIATKSTNSNVVKGKLVY